MTTVALRALEVFGWCFLALWLIVIATFVVWMLFGNYITKKMRG